MRALTATVVAGVLALLVAGCGPKKEEIPQMEPAEVRAVTQAPAGPAPVETPRATVARPRTAAPGAADSETAGSARAGQTSIQTYTMKAGDTLYTLAQRFYGDPKLWTRIAEANRDKITDVSRIPVGTVLIIPPK
jgi:5'-nucleotidase